MEIRWRGHCHSARSGSQCHFHRAIAAYGVDNWTHEILATTESLIEAAALEQRYINEFRTFEPELGYNMTLGGEGPTGYRHTTEARQRMSKMRKGVSLGPKSLEHRQSLSKSRKGRRATEETRQRMREAHLRPDVREKQSKLKSRPVAQYDLEGKLLKIFPSVNAAAEETSGDKGCIAMCARGARKNTRHAGFVWRYVDLGVL